MLECTDTDDPGTRQTRGGNIRKHGRAPVGFSLCKIGKKMLVVMAVTLLTAFVAPSNLPPASPNFIGWANSCRYTGVAFPEFHFT